MSIIDMSNTSANLKVLRAYGNLKRRLNILAVHQLKPLGIGVQQAILIGTLFDQGTMSMTELSKATGCDPAATGKALSSLIDRDWVERRDNPLDKRRWDVQLTRAGRRVAGQVTDVFEEMAHRLCHKLTKNERDVLGHLLQKAAAHLIPNFGDTYEHSHNK
jgi:DNA-binding MarR family transcriptional regulator